MTPNDPYNPFPNLIVQSDSGNETSDCPCTVFVPKRKNDTAQSNEDDESNIPLNDPEEAHPNIPFVDLDDASVASDSASVADSNNPDELRKSHLYLRI